MCGLPVVTSAIGAEGMRLDDGLLDIQNDVETVLDLSALNENAIYPAVNVQSNFGGYVVPSSDPLNFARAAEALYSVKSNWQHARNIGWRVVDRRFSAEQSLALWTRLEMQYKELVENRTRDLGQCVFLRPEMLSVRALSRYIEAKTQSVPHSGLSSNAL